MVPLPAHTGDSKFDLSLATAELPDGLAASVEYATDLFDRATVLRLLGQFEALLEQAVERPEERVAALSLQAPPERAPLLVEWNDTAAATPGADGGGLVDGLDQHQFYTSTV